ncbi:MAG TPA: peptidoglycan recognition protein [Baekduia sp.]|nr:peptidoglycan recognition protein [Baekduia sp.]
MLSAALTRRRALAAGAAVGAATLSTRVPVAGARAAARPRGTTLDVAPAAFGPGRRTGVLAAPRRFDLLGVRGAAPAGLELRVRERGGAWSRWVALGHGAHHGPDARGALASDPVWTGGADELQLRARRPPRSALRVHFVTVGAAARVRGARAAASSRRAQASQGGPPPVIGRAAWGGGSVKPRAAPSYGSVVAAFVHHTVTANDYGPEDSAGIVLGIAKYHRDTNGWNDIGYNFLVDQYGQVFEGRAGGIDQPVIGAQAQGYNAQSTGVAILGTHGAVPASPAALEAVARLLAWKLPLHGAPVEGQVVVESAGGSQNRYAAGTPVTLERISGHRDGDSTSCPGNALYAQLPEIRRRAAALAPSAIASVVRLSMGPLPGAPAYGETLRPAGVLRRGDGSPVAGQAVLVQKRGSKGWVTVARATTDRDGAWRAGVTWRKSGRVRARAAVQGSPVAVTPTVAVGLTPVAELRSATGRVRAGSSLTLDARLLGATDAVLLVERETGGRFRRVAKLPVPARRSRWRRRVPLRRPGLYRLVLRAEAGGVAVRSAPVVVRAVRAGASLEAAPEPGGGVAAPGAGTTAGSGGTAAGA